MNLYRQTGRTTDQLERAPLAAYYVCANRDEVHLIQEIATSLGRHDLTLITLRQLKNSLRGRHVSDVIVDHHAAEVMTELDFQHYCDALIYAVKPNLSKETIMHDELNEGIEEISFEREIFAHGKVIRPVINCYTDPSEDDTIFVAMGMRDFDDGSINFDPICAMHSSEYDPDTGELQVPLWFPDDMSKFVFFFAIDPKSIALDEFVEYVQTDYADTINAQTSYMLELHALIAESFEAVDTCGCDVCQCGDEPLGFETGYDEQVRSAPFPKGDSEKATKFEDTEWVS